MTEQRNAYYAIPCAFGHPDDDDEDSLFFTTFETKDEDEALALATCVCGPKGKLALVIINSEGDYYPVF